MIEEIVKNQWFELLEQQKAFCYFRPTRRKHDSGFRCLEIGYCTMVEGGRAKVKNKIVLSHGSDVIDSNRWNREKRTIKIDLTMDGYFRIFSDEPIWWGSLDFVVFSTYLCKLNEFYL